MDEKYRQSINLLIQAEKVTPLGAQTFSKCHRYYVAGNAPHFLEKGEGCHVWDVDGNKYIDFVLGLGPVTIGYNDSRVDQAIVEQLAKGISLSLPVELEIRLAEKLAEIIPCAEQVRFVKNGSDATTAAVRLARAYTGRDMLAMCGYHGMHDWSIGASEIHPGIPEAVAGLTRTFQYNDIVSLQRLMEERPGQIAAVILEPIQGNGPGDGFLEEVRGIASAQGAVLIFDEVVSGFRYALGGASELYGVIPDLAAVGKGMANGMPISAVVGKRELMQQIESKGVFISTTFGGETLSLAAALATIEILEEPGSYEYIWSLGKTMLDGLRELIGHYALGKVLSVSGLPPHGGIVFEGSGSLDYLDISSLYSQRMVREGILTLGINNLSLAHNPDNIAEFLKKAELAMQDIQSALFGKNTDSLLYGKKIDPIFKRNI